MLGGSRIHYMQELSMRICKKYNIRILAKNSSSHCRMRHDVLFLALHDEASLHRNIGVLALRERFASWITVCRYSASRVARLRAHAVTLEELNSRWKGLPGARRLQPQKRHESSSPLRSPLHLRRGWSAAVGSNSGRDCRDCGFRKRNHRIQ